LKLIFDESKYVSLILLIFFLNLDVFVAKAINNIGDKIIDLMFYSLNKLKQVGVDSVTINPLNNNIQFMDSTGVLTIRSNRYVDSNDVNANFPHYTYNQHSAESSLNFDAEFIRAKRSKELDMATISLGKDLNILLNHINKLPSNPPMRNKSFFSEKKKYREALICHLNEIDTSEEFKFFPGTQRINLVPDYQKNCNNPTTGSRQTIQRPIRVQEGSILNTGKLSNEFQNIVKELSENIFFSVTGEEKEQGSKEMIRRRELRFHVELFKSYLRLQAFCEINLRRRQGETTKSQAKLLISYFYPAISISNMDLMLQRAPRIYRLLEIAADWRLLDAFEDLTPCFFKSKMKTANNFEIWISLVRTGRLIGNDELNSQEKIKEVKRIKIEIIKEYFDITGIDFDEVMDDDE